MTTVLAPSQTRDRLIVALDVSTAREAGELVRRIGDAAGLFKVGLQLFTNEGPALVREMVASDLTAAERDSLVSRHGYRTRAGHG